MINIYASKLSLELLAPHQLINHHTNLFKVFLSNERISYYYLLYSQKTTPYHNEKLLLELHILKFQLQTGS